MAVHLVPYIRLDGNTREAVAFYAKALNAEVAGIMTFGEMPPMEPNQPPMPEAVKNRIAHAVLKVGESELMFSDTFPGFPFNVGNNLTITLVTDDVAKTTQAFDALSEGGKVTMPLQKTFWSPAYGQLTDKYGVEWQLSTGADA